MKIRFYLALAAAALVMTNCSQEEALVQVNQPSKGFTATIEGASRSNATEAGVFSWTAGDEISVYTKSNSFDVYKNSEAYVNTFAPQGEDVGVPTGYAIYPAGEHRISGQDVTINLPATYAYGSTNAPMLATIEESSSNLAFKHLAGLMRFVVKNVPAGASSFVFTTENNILTGDYNVVDGQIRQNGESPVNNNNSVTIEISELATTQDEMVFFVPLPVGTYGNYTVEIKGEGIDLSCESEGVSNTIGRCSMLLMPEFTVEGNQLNKGAGSTIAIDAEEANLSGNQSVTIDASGVQDASATLVLNYTPQEGNATLNITDGSGEEESQNSKAKIEIVPEGVVESLNLNTPTLTVELGEGTYGTVEALTATQTLIIGDGVTIETLILNGGALQVAEGATTSTIENIVVKDAASFIEALKVAENITLADDIALNLTTGSFLTIDEDKVVSIDLSGKTLTTSATSDSNVPDDITVKGTLIVKDGNVKTANTAFFANGGTLTLTDCDVTTTSTYGATAVMVSGATGKLNISGGSYTGQGADIHDRYVIGVIGGSSATINTTVSGGNGGVTVIGASTAELTGGSYSGVKACGLYVAGGSTVTYSNCTFDGVEGDVVVGGGSYGNGTVNGTQYTEYTKIKLISTAEELKSILSEGGNVTLADDVEEINLDLTTGSFLTIGEGKEVSIDLNGKTLTTSTVSDSNVPDDITVKGTLIVKNGNVKTANTAFFASGGTLTLTDCNVTTSSTYGATAVMVSGAAGNLNISGGSYTGQGADIHDRYVIGVIGGSSATINTTVSGGNGGVTVIGASTANLTGGSYSGVKACGLYVAGGSTVTYANDCIFSGVEGNVVVGGGTYGNGTVNGHEYTEYTKIQ